MRLRLNNNRGFTLIEILVVLALTVMTMGLIFGPLVQSLKITRSAEIIVRTQDNARNALAQVSGDLSNAMYVFDNTTDYVIFKVPDEAGVVQRVPVYFANMDLVLPRMRGFCPVDSSHTPGGVVRGEDAAPICTHVDANGQMCGAPLDMRPIQPLTQDTKIVRYFIGLQNPTQPYLNGYLRALAEAGGDNTFILYRAEYTAGDADLFPQQDLQGNPLDTWDKQRQYEDFFNDTNLNPHGVPYCVAWRKISRPVVTLEDIDLITMTYDPTGSPVVTPLVKFAPTAIYNDPLVPTNTGEDDPQLADCAPTTYKATYGNWVMPYKVTLEPELLPDGSNANVTFETMLGPDFHDPTKIIDVYVYKVDQSGGSPVYTPMLDLTHYEETRASSAYDAGDMYPVSVRERAFTVDATKGIVNCAFPNVDTSPSKCPAMNNLVPGGAGNKRPLSDMWHSDWIVDGPPSRPDLAGMFVINAPHTIGPPVNPCVLPYSTVVPGSVKVTAPDETRKEMQPVPFVTYTCAPYLMRDPEINQFTCDIGYNLDMNGSACPGAAAVYFHRSRNVDVAGAPPSGIPKGQNNVLFYYQVQNNKKGDVLRANYVTKSVMTVVMGIQIWDAGIKRPQVVQFTNKIRLKNIAS
jgi:prepilin-type N-terminal cleavage/methylation domain-containing protein